MYHSTRLANDVVTESLDDLSAGGFSHSRYCG